MIKRDVCNRRIVWNVLNALVYLSIQSESLPPTKPPNTQSKPSGVAAKLIHSRGDGGRAAGAHVAVVGLNWSRSLIAGAVQKGGTGQVGKGRGRGQEALLVGRVMPEYTIKGTRGLKGGFSQLERVLPEYTIKGQSASRSELSLLAQRGWIKSISACKNHDRMSEREIRHLVFKYPVCLYPIRTHCSICSSPPYGPYPPKVQIIPFGTAAMPSMCRG